MTKKDVFAQVLMTLIAYQIPMDQAIKQANDAAAAWEAF